MTWAKANKRPRTVRTYQQCVARERIEQGVGVMVNRELACLRGLYNRCREWDEYDGANPMVTVKMFKESAGRLRYLEPDEERRLLAAADEPLRTMILVGIYTGVPAALRGAHAPLGRLEPRPTDRPGGLREVW